MRVLLAEDDPTIASPLVRRLERGGLRGGPRRVRGRRRRAARGRPAWRRVSAW